MNLLTALQKEKRLLGDRIYNMKLYMQKQSDVISKTPYTEDDVQQAQWRMEEIEVAITAIIELRKNRFGYSYPLNKKTDETHAPL